MTYSLSSPKVRNFQFSEFFISHTSNQQQAKIQEEEIQEKVSVYINIVETKQHPNKDQINQWSPNKQLIFYEFCLSIVNPDRQTVITNLKSIISLIRTTHNLNHIKTDDSSKKIADLVIREFDLRRTNLTNASSFPSLKTCIKIAAVGVAGILMIDAAYQAYQFLGSTSALNDNPHFNAELGNTGNESNAELVNTGNKFVSLKDAIRKGVNLMSNDIFDLMSQNLTQTVTNTFSTCKACFGDSQSGNSLNIIISPDNLQKLSIDFAVYDPVQFEYALNNHWKISNNNYNCVDLT